jgi:hypothetical protein
LRFCGAAKRTSGFAVVPITCLYMAVLYEGWERAAFPLRPEPRAKTTDMVEDKSP